MTRWLVLGAILAAAGCREEPPERPMPPWLPSLLQAPELDASKLANTEDCAQCHPDVASHWMHSAHAYASFDNPWYRASVDSFREARGRAESRFCAGCHDPLLLSSGGIDDEVSPDDDLAYAGITCLVCHSVESSRPDGNASFTLTSDPVLMPDPASLEEIRAHRERLALDPLRTVALCGSCHRSFSGPSIGNPVHLGGIDDLGDWASSAFGGGTPEHLVSVDAKRCQDCHMPREPASESEMAAYADGEIRAHRWAASHTAMAAQLPDPPMLEGAASALREAAVLDFGSISADGRRYLLPERSELHGGEHLVFDVLVENQGTGHRFPGGVRDLQDTWIEVELRDADGELLAASRPTGDGEQEVFVFRATMLDQEGNPELMHRVDRFFAPAFDRTLDAHDAQAIRYSIRLPRRLRLPLRLEARLMHRKHNLRFQAFACEASRTERGVEFAKGAARRGKVPLDPCQPQPVTEMARAVAWVGGDAAARPRVGGPARPVIERLLAQGLALLHGTQEHVGAALPAIDEALAVARREGPKEAQARALILRARVAAIEGKVEQARLLTSRAEASIGPHPVLDRLRGDAYARTWRWTAAAEAYRRVTVASPLDWRAWRDLARALGSLSENDEALEAADRGLALAPREESLLRSRFLALEALGSPQAAKAKAQWLAHRLTDRQPAILGTCEQTHDRCRRDRQPIPHYTLTPFTKSVHASVDPR